MNRFFVPSENISNDKIFITDTEDIHHMLKVLRMRIGQKIEISESGKADYIGEICDANSEIITCNIIEKLKTNREPEVKITLIQGLPKQGKMELIIQKAVELGVKNITPCVMKRSINSDASKVDKKIERWQKIAKEAAQQSKRGEVPVVSDCLKFNELKNRFKDFDLVLICYEDEKEVTLKDVINEVKVANGAPKDIAIIIGPEGGLDKKEVSELLNIGAKCVSLGKTILRTETAGLVAISMIMYDLEI